MVAERVGPLMMNYQMNAGYVPPDHWVHGDEGGGRNLGEACHIYDLFTFLTGAKVTDVVARGIRPGQVSTVRQTTSPPRLHLKMDKW